MSFENNIRTWVHLDDDIKLLNEQINILKNKKKICNTEIINYLNQQNIINPTIKISDGKLKIINSQYHAPLTFKYLQFCLLHYFNNDINKVENLINFIKSKRLSKINKEIKRFSKEAA